MWSTRHLLRLTEGPLSRSLNTEASNLRDWSLLKPVLYNYHSSVSSNETYTSFAAKVVIVSSHNGTGALLRSAAHGIPVHALVRVISLVFVTVAIDRGAVASIVESWPTISRCLTGRHNDRKMICETIERGQNLQFPDITVDYVLSPF